MTRHLDLGCGGVPRNPYAYDELFGVDLSGSAKGGAIRRAKLALQPIPFDSDPFDLVSAYDFQAHLPRLRLAHRIRRGACGHLIWEFEAVKPPAARP